MVFSASGCLRKVCTVCTFAKLALLLCAPIVYSQTRFSSVLELGQSGTGPSVAGGDEAASTEFPASFWYKLNAFEHCSSTVVGPQVVVTAAHCIQGDPKIVLSIGGAEYIGDCKSSSRYDRSDNSYNFPRFSAPSEKNTSADLALCRINRRVAGISYDKVVSPGTIDKTGEKLLLSGYGCAGFAGIARTDYKFRIGDTIAHQVPNANSYYIVADGNAAVCPGDSGGATYRVAPGGFRWLAGVNSRTNQIRTSYITSLASAAAHELLKEFEQTYPDSICGRGNQDVACQ